MTQIVGGVYAGYNPNTALPSIQSSASPQPGAANYFTYNGVQYDSNSEEGKAALANALGVASPETLQDVADKVYSKQFAGGMSVAELKDFETLVSRLEASKMKQAGQANRARQRETYGKGLASIMRNF